MKERLGVGMVGYAFMGAAHSHAWRSVNRFFDLPVAVDMRVLCGRASGPVEAAAEKYGWADFSTNWTTLLDNDDIDIVDICTPGDSHAEIAIAALEAGKHVLCEKPLANSVAEAEAMAEAAASAHEHGVRAMVGFNYRRVPALAFARELVAQGRLGEIRHVRARYLQDWLVDPQSPMSWRLRKEEAGSGALGDIGAHIVDLSQFLLADEITEVSSLLETFIKERPLPGGGGEVGTVTVDDCALFMARFGGGIVGSFEASRHGTGRKNSMSIEISGSSGSLAFDFESMNELHWYDNTDDNDTAGFRRILATEASHPYVAAWWPPGHGLGYEHTFTHEIRDFIEGVATGTDPRPTFADGLQVQRVLAAIESSSASRTWQTVDA